MTRIAVCVLTTTSIRMRMWCETIVEHAAGFAFGLLVLQALLIQDMLGSSDLATTNSMRRVFVRAGSEHMSLLDLSGYVRVQG